MRRRELVERADLDRFVHRRPPARSGAGRRECIAERSGFLSEDRPGGFHHVDHRASLRAPQCVRLDVPRGVGCAGAPPARARNLDTGSNDTIGPVKPTSSRSLSWNWPKFAPTSTTTSTSYQRDQRAEMLVERKVGQAPLGNEQVSPRAQMRNYPAPQATLQGHLELCRSHLDRTREDASPKPWGAPMRMTQYVERAESSVTRHAVGICDPRHHGRRVTRMRAIKLNILRPSPVGGKWRESPPRQCAVVTRGVAEASPSRRRHRRPVRRAVPGHACIRCPAGLQVARLM